MSSLSRLAFIARRKMSSGKVNFKSFFQKLNCHLNDFLLEWILSFTYRMNEMSTSSFIRLVKCQEYPRQTGRT